MVSRPLVGELLLLGAFRAALLLTSPASLCRKKMKYHFMTLRAAARCPCSITLLKRDVTLCMAVRAAAGCPCSMPLQEQQLEIPFHGSEGYNRMPLQHNNNNNNFQAFQLIVFARYLLGAPKP